MAPGARGTGSTPTRRGSNPRSSRAVWRCVSATGSNISALALPEHTRPVDAFHRLGDAMLGAVVLGGGPAGGNGAVVVDDGESSHRQLRVQRPQDVHGGAVHVPVGAQHGKLLDRGVGQGVAEPAL